MRKRARSFPAKRTECGWPEPERVHRIHRFPQIGEGEELRNTLTSSALHSVEICVICGQNVDRLPQTLRCVVAVHAGGGFGVADAGGVRVSEGGLSRSGGWTEDSEGTIIAQRRGGAQRAAFASRARLTPGNTGCRSSASRPTKRTPDAGTRRRDPGNRCTLPCRVERLEPPSGPGHRASHRSARSQERPGLLDLVGTDRRAKTVRCAA